MSDSSSSSSNQIISSSSSSETINYISKYIEPIETGVDSVDYIINNLVLPQIFMFCEIDVHYEVGARLRDGSYKFTYGNWNEAFQPEVFLNGADTQLNPSNYQVDYDKGIIIPKYQTSTGDNIICTYNFSWFTPDTLASFVERTIPTINYHGSGATSSYTISDLPESFYGISADLCVAMCMQNLLLSVTMWKGKLIFAISANDLYNGGGDVASQLETIKHNCEDRAYSSLQNDRMRAPNTLARPTPAYWRSVTMGNGIRQSPHGKMDYNKLRGHKFNKMAGLVGPDTGDLQI